MSTLYILHGGESSRNTDANDAFFREILSHCHSASPQVLCVYFARPRDRWEEAFWEDKLRFSRADKKGLATYLRATPDPDDFRQEVIRSDVIFINGGRQGNLKEMLLSVKDLKSLFEGKIVVGVSAGANLLGIHYYSTVAHEIRHGIGIIPYKIFTHYSSNFEHERDQLNHMDYKSDLITIPEEQYYIVEE